MVKAKSVLLALPQPLLDQVDLHRAKLGVSRTRFLQQAVQEHIAALKEKSLEADVGEQAQSRVRHSEGQSHCLNRGLISFRDYLLTLADAEGLTLHQLVTRDTQQPS